MYAIIDIETTGGQFNKEGITEIAIYKFDGVEIVDQFISLVNPEIPIQPFVVKLTGINNAMLRQAPKFFEVAKRIIEITEGCIIVAHNAPFDYRVLKLEFNRLGYKFQKPTLCTVEMSKVLLPDAKAYSLGKLVRSLGIPIADRHRASGDAMATLKLFKLLLDKDIDKQIVKQQIKNEVHQGISPKLFDILENIPTSIGIFYIHNDKGSIIFIGKSNNIRKKLNQIFTADTKIAKRIQKEVYTVTFEETGNELIALLKEREELLHNKPVLNTAQRKSLFLWSVYQEKLENGYETLKIHKNDGRKNAIQSFKNQKSALQFINELYKENEIVEEVQNALSSAENINYPTVLHNELFVSLITSNQLKYNNIIIVLKGRNLNEKSAVVIENGIFKGFCFFDLNYQILNAQVLSKILIPLIYTKDVLNTVKHYLSTKKDYKIISF
ncbi:exonuclease domain-containing protein [Flavobacterium dauae]|uniref:exonuclease domain-containing protein n=1 Tax=Flavobacterium dauae TaxID=1563479 RepID=UPI00101B4C61|nr:exonuclease domain-containing protein [Flavobacterium dauae]WLD25013.1 exonuclease domain-containing protein [Flavobacterium dauae]